jgi:hypothetical protein
MRITESQLRKIVREEAKSLSEAPGEAPRAPYRPATMSYSKPGQSEAERTFARLIRDRGADWFAKELIYALGDSERAESLARFMSSL